MQNEINSTGMEETEDTMVENEKKEPMELVVSKDINGVLVDGYYKDGKAWYNRTQIGQALGYSNPNTAIMLIHKRHKERLDQFSRVYQFDTPSGVQEGYVYNLQGVFEICRWSKQPVADAVMDGLYAMAEEVMRKGYYSALPPEQLMLQVIENASDKEKLRRVIIPALRDADVGQDVLMAEYMGLTAEEFRSGAKMLKKADANDRAKYILRDWKRWKCRKYTLEDLPNTYCGKMTLLLSLTQCKKSIKNYGHFADYCGTTYFNKAGYKDIIDFLIKKKYISYEEGLEWARNERLL